MSALSESLQTTDVTIRYDVTGRGRLIICAHGFPDCQRSFRLQVPALVDAGYRVATPAMRAYAPSSVAHSGRYDPAALGSDLVALADALSPDDPVDVLGHDWGAVAAVAATDVAPGRFRKLITVAVPHLRVAARRWLRPQQLKKSWYMGLFQLPRYAERRVLENDMALIDRLWRDWSPGWTCPEEEMRHVKAAIAPNVTEVLSYYRPRGRTPRSVFNKTTVPALHVHGIDDGCIGVEMTQGIAHAYTAGVEVQLIGDAGHFVHLEKPAAFNRLMLRFLREGS